MSAKEGLPEKEGYYYGETLRPNSPDTYWFSTVGSNANKFSRGAWRNLEIEYWLEEIESPTKEQIESEMKKRCTNWGGYFNGGDAKWFNRGARWMMNVLAGKAVTAKDNVR